MERSAVLSLEKSESKRHQIGCNGIIIVRSNAAQCKPEDSARV
jgi:hypothetical protein